MSQPHMVFVYGCYASGKTSLLEQITSTYIDVNAPIHTFKVFNKELFIFDIPEYQQAVKEIHDCNVGRIPSQEDAMAASQIFAKYNDVGSERMHHAISAAVEKKQNMVIEVVSIPPYIHGIVEAAANKGYKIHCIYTKVSDVSVVIQRVYDRWLRTRKFPTPVEKIMRMFRGVNTYWDEFVLLLQQFMYTIVIIDTTYFTELRLEYVYCKAKQACNVWGIELSPCVFQPYYI